MPTRRLIATLILSLSLALAAPVQLTPVGTKDEFALLGKAPIQFTFDAAQRTLNIPEGQLAPNVTLPEGVRAEQSDKVLILRLPDDYQVSLSQDGFRLQLIRGGGATTIALPAATTTVTPAVTTTVPPTTVTPPGAALPAIPAPAVPAANTLAATPQAIVASPVADPATLTTMVYPLSYASPSQVAQLFTDLYGTIRVRVDERRHALVALVSPADRAILEAFIKKVDTPSPLVSFEAQVLEVNRNLTSSLGIDYDKIFTLKLTEAAPGASIFKLGDIVRNPLGLTIGINLLENSGAARVLAKPRITALDGVEARINATQTYPLVVNGGQNTTPVVQNITTGIAMRMLPRVAPNGDIEVQITISVSTPTGVTAEGAPQYSSREATTIVRVKDGEPIAIGGLIEDRKIEGVSKVPLLGDIPLLGRLFQSKTTDQRNTDLVIIITPTILKGGATKP
jgi:general secretion pathway protein D